MTIKTTDLGLPIEYQDLPEFFDAHNINADTNAKNELIENLLRQYNVKTVFDMTCGTGSQTLYLAQKRYDVIGSDLSGALIKQAQKKAKDLNLNIKFMTGDMRTIQMGQFDAVITIFSAIGHLSKADFEIALQNIRTNLAEGGIYIFDIFNLDALTDDVIKTFVMDIEREVNGTNMRNQQTSEIDRENNLLISYDQYTISQTNEEPKTHTNKFSLQIYTAEELKDLLAKNGFEVLSQSDLDGKVFDKDKSLSVLTVARKV